MCGIEFCLVFDGLQVDVVGQVLVYYVVDFVGEYFVCIVFQIVKCSFDDGFWCVFGYFDVLGYVGVDEVGMQVQYLCFLVFQFQLQVVGY